MNSEKEQWIKKYALIALNAWQDRPHPFDISSDYRRQLEEDLADHYDDPLKRQFVEAIWSG